MDKKAKRVIRLKRLKKELTWLITLKKAKTNEKEKAEKS